MPTNYDYEENCEISAFGKEKCNEKTKERYHLSKGLKEIDAFLCKSHSQKLKGSWLVK